MSTRNRALLGTTNARRNDQIEAQLARFYLLLMVICDTVVAGCDATRGRWKCIVCIATLALLFGRFSTATDCDLL